MLSTLGDSYLDKLAGYQQSIATVSYEEMRKVTRVLLK